MTPTELSALYQRVRATTERLVEPLSVEDMVVQTMPDVSPTKWHLGHTTWFFETFVLQVAGQRPYDERFAPLFNSYYNSVGIPHPRSARGHLSRPTVEEVRAWRRHVDKAMAAWFARADDASFASLAPVVEVGVNHEEQHQELLLTDVKHVLATNPLAPAYRPVEPRRGVAVPLAWRTFDGGLVDVGHAGHGFAYDNEMPRHRQWLAPFAVATRLVTCGEWLEFMRDRGYERADFWLAEGWETRRAQAWSAPLYWRGGADEWTLVTLGGERNVDPREPVCHVSFYEADAFARWAGARLPSEAEWELVAASAPPEGNLVERGAFHPAPLAAAPSGAEIAQLFGDVWEWTASPYLPYPGYRPFQGMLAEYNGKFMCNQFVLRGGSCATPARHIRRSYRNFFPPSARWQFTGIRLARGG
jgi:ergothioneine biosynthesis protein EgtB